MHRQRVRRFDDQAVGIDERHCPSTCCKPPRGIGPDGQLGEKYGYARQSPASPDRTIALVMDCDTTGVEPDFALVKFKKLAGAATSKSSTPRSRPLCTAWAIRRSRSTNCQYSKAPAPSKAARSSTAPAQGQGFTDEILQQIEGQLPGAFDLNFVFNRWTLATLLKSIGIAEDRYASNGFNLLDALASRSSRLPTATTSSRHMTIEGSRI